MSHQQYGRLALKFCQVSLPLQVLKSNAGFYIGTRDDEGPVSRESDCYFASREEAEQALASDDWPRLVM